MHMDWNELKMLKKWLPISQLSIEVQQLGRNLLKLGENKYCLATPYADKTLEVKPGGPFLSALLWSCGDGASFRVISSEVEKDENTILVPPVELLPVSGATSYPSILHGLKSKTYKGISETASYRVTTDGAFIHRVIESEIAAYYFRSREMDNDQMPYAILWKLLPSK